MRVSGPHHDRVLLLGGGIAVGYGALDHELALGGQLAKTISALSGRGLVMEILAGRDFQIGDAIRLLGGIKMASFDGIVMTFGGSESASLIPTKSWRVSVDATLDYIKLTVPRTHTFVVAIPEIAGLPTGWGRLALRQSREFNEQSRLACAGRDEATFVTTAPLDPDVQERMNGATYHEWAKVIGPQVVPALDASAEMPRPEFPPDEESRQSALDRLGVRGTATNSELNSLVATARGLFQASGASVNLIDRERQWTKASEGIETPDMPRSDSICDYTIRTAELFVVPDIWADARFAHLPWATGNPPIRFYAGYPLESPDGERIGALCIVDTEPRQFSPEEARLLQDLALRAQSLLWTS